VTVVKICGIRETEHARAAAAAGAKMIGFIFAPARRQVELDTATAIIGALHTEEHPPAATGVFVNATATEIAETVRRCGLDAVQLSGDEEVGLVAQLPAHVQVLKVVRLAGAPHEDAWLAWHAEPRVRLLVDAHTPGSYGGAGVVANWERAAELARERPILLAGGLTPENVAEAIRVVRPWGVDVSSGVETDGVKESAKIRAFLAAARGNGA
jgi:phosphoribosylanthranilate isomerase